VRLKSTLAAVAFTAGLSAIVAWPSPTIRAGFDYQPIAATEARRIITASTVKLVTLGCDLSERNGTAVAIGRGRLVTNKHVVDQARQVDAIPDLGPYSPGITAVNRADVDLATVGTPDLQLTGIPLATTDPTPGAAVTLAGYPGGDALTLGAAKVVDYVPGGAVGQAVDVMRLAAGPAVAQPGMSGGPVLDGRGHLAGLIFGRQSPSGYVLALPASAIRDQLTQPGTFEDSNC
jgi:S1-C subfamily serine protease